MKLVVGGHCLAEKSTAKTFGEIDMRSTKF